MAGPRCVINAAGRLRFKPHQISRFTNRLGWGYRYLMGRAYELRIPPPFDQAVKSMEREIMRFLMRSTGDREDAKDLFQETWLHAYRAYPTLQSEDGLRPWI